MSNSMKVKIKYIDGRLQVTNGDSSDEYASICFEAIYAINISPLSNARCAAHALGATRNYLESTSKIRGVSQVQKAAILESIESALCFHYTVGWTYAILENTPFVVIPVANVLSGDCEKIIVLSIVGNSDDGCEASLHAIIPYRDCLRVDVCEPAPREWRIKFCKPRKKREVYRFGSFKPTSNAVIKNLRIIASFSGGNRCTYFDSMGGRLAIQARAATDGYDFMYNMLLLILDGKEISSYDEENKYDARIYYRKENEAFYYEHVER